MNKGNFITRAYSLEKQDIEAIEGLGERHSTSKSSALRLIIREWAQMKEERARLLSTRLDPRDPYWLTEAGKEQSR